jgi:hypothetical protein
MGPPLSGWVQVLFPYTTEIRQMGGRPDPNGKMQPNFYAQNWRQAYECAVKHGIYKESGTLGMPVCICLNKHILFLSFSFFGLCFGF